MTEAPGGFANAESRGDGGENRGQEKECERPVRPGDTEKLKTSQPDNN